jgi:glycosyltransferase involved in cell wall biosynthesis
VRPAFAAARVYVLPSYREGTPRTVLEAMAMGRPIVTTDVPGCRETVIDGVNGLLVAARDDLALETALERFILDPSLADRMGRKSLVIAQEKYDVHKVNAVIMATMNLELARAEYEPVNLRDTL